MISPFLFLFPYTKYFLYNFIKNTAKQLTLCKILSHTFFHLPSHTYFHFYIRLTTPIPITTEVIVILPAFTYNSNSIPTKPQHKTCDYLFLFIHAKINNSTNLFCIQYKSHSVVTKRPALLKTLQLHHKAAKYTQPALRLLNGNLTASCI